MNEHSIAFPHLGITLEHVGKSFSIFGFEVAFYGMIIGTGIIVGLLLALMEAKRTKQNPDIYLDYVVYAVLCSIIGARIYYVAFSWEDYKGDILAIINIRNGGMAIYGAVIGAVISLVVYTKIKKLNGWQVADTGCIGLIAGQAIGRWGNFFNREAFGGYTDNLFAMKLPISAVRQHEITQEMLDHATDGAIQVHPTFLYESMWNLGVLLFLLIYRKHKKFEGELVFWYLGLYGMGRFWIEGLRTDQLQIGNTGLAVSQCLAAVLFLVSAVILLYKHIRIKKAGKAL